MDSAETPSLLGHWISDTQSLDYNDSTNYQIRTESISMEVISGDVSSRASTHALRLTKSRRESRFFGGWRSGVSLGLVTAIIVFIVNLAVAIWTFTRPTAAAGITILFEGDCTKARRISLWGHVVINVLSTLLLGASNNALQCISSPTREEVEVAHAEDDWMDIGVPSIGNVSRIASRRQLLWICLALSSIPLHLLYNSVIFTSTSSNDYIVLVGSAASPTGPWNFSSDLVEKMQDITASVNFTRLENDECSRVFRQQLIQDYQNLILVLNTSESGIVYNVSAPNIALGFNQNPFFCGNTSDGLDCDSPGVLNSANNWKWNPYNCHNSSGQIPQEHEENCLAITDPEKHAVLAYCLAEESVQDCKVEISRVCILTVLICNSLKVMSLFALLVLPEFYPLVTIGDAIASLLASPDSTTSHKSALMHKHPNPKYASCTETSSVGSFSTSGFWHPQRARWFYAAPYQNWVVAALLGGGLWIAALILLILGIVGRSNSGYSNGLRSLWSIGFGTVDASSIIQPTFAAPFTSTVLAVNLPQLLLSFIYVLYNTLFTAMLRSSEYISMSLHRKPLRVSRPSGCQRSTYWLQLPLRFALPLMVASGTMHWLVSESVFLVDIQILNSTFDDGPTTISACGWSGIALIFVLLLGGLMIITLGAFAYFMKYPPGLVPDDRGSFAISKRCHPLNGGQDTTEFYVKYGFVKSVEGNGKGKLGFSTGEVERLLEGDVYECEDQLERCNANIMWYKESKWYCPLPLDTGLMEYRKRKYP